MYYSKYFQWTNPVPAPIPAPTPVSVWEALSITKHWILLPDVFLFLVNHNIHLMSVKLLEL